MDGETGCGVGVRVIVSYGCGVGVGVSVGNTVVGDGVFVGGRGDGMGVNVAVGVVVSAGVAVSTGVFVRVIPGTGERVGIALRLPIQPKGQNKTVIKIASTVIPTTLYTQR